MVNIAGLDKAEVLSALHNASRAQGLGFLHDKGGLSVEECRGIIKQYEKGGDPNLQGFTVIGGSNLYFDYLAGRVMKVDLAKDEFDPRLYDRDIGEGAAQRAIDRLRERILAASCDRTLNGSTQESEAEITQLSDETVARADEVTDRTVPFGEISTG